MTTNTGQHPGAEGPWHDVSDAALAHGMRPDADDATYVPAWREFEHRHLPQIKRFVETRLGDVDDAVLDEVLLETELRIQRGIEKFKDRGTGKLRSWCLKVAQRTLQDYWRGHAPFVPDGPADAGALVSFDEIAEQYALARVVGNLDDCQAIAGREADEHDDDPRLLTEREQVMIQSCGQSWMVRSAPSVLGRPPLCQGCGRNVTVSASNLIFSAGPAPAPS